MQSAFECAPAYNAPTRVSPTRRRGPWCHPRWRVGLTPGQMQEIPVQTTTHRAFALVLLLLLVPFPVRAQDTVQTPKVEGMWLGTLKVQGVEARIGFIIQTKDGLLIATLESIDQNKRGVPVKEVSVKDGTVRLANKALYFSYEG